MSLSEVLVRKGKPLISPTVPNTNYVDAAIKRVFDRWEDINPEAREEDYEKIIAEMHRRISNGNWQNVKMSFVVMAFNVAFLPKYKKRKDVKEITDFALEELRATSKPSIVNALLRIYSTNFSPTSDVIADLANILLQKQNLFSDRWKKIVTNFPDYLKPTAAPDNIANFMLRSENAWNALRQAGIYDPFATGLMDYVHKSYVLFLSPELEKKDKIKTLFEWLIPESGKQKVAGNVIVIKSLLDKWLTDTPPEDLRQYITENLISLYDDPRIRADRWAAVEQKYKDVLFNWLTKEDLRFFISVVDATQKDPMWVRRRNFWLKLYDEKLIEQAWVAFCPSAARYARQNLSSSRTELSENRFARQVGRQYTSILLLKIGNKIFVDGCHNYSTHVWDMSDPVAPRLFKSRYDCDIDLRLKSPVGRGKSHSSIPSWSAWVREKIYSSIPNSNAKPVNWDAANRNFAFRNNAMKPSSPEKAGLQADQSQNYKIFNQLNPSKQTRSNPPQTTIKELHSSNFEEATVTPASSFDINQGELKNEFRLLRANSNVKFNFFMGNVYNRALANKALSVSEKSALNSLFSRHGISKDDYPTVFNFLQPIFKIENNKPNLELWAPAIGSIEVTIKKHNMSVSPKQIKAIQKIKSGNQSLDIKEINAMEHLLQTFRSMSISLDALLK